MKNEAVIEKGIVLKAGDSRAEIELIDEGNCKECSARIFCKPSEKKKSKILEVEDPYGVLPGDEVKIQIAGETILKASFFLYGVPLILIIVGILFGIKLFANSFSPELFSFLFGISLTALYYSSIFLLKKIKPAQPKLPQITFVKRL